ncbi:MAG: DUF2493 domain-containing protein [Clostridia bacterium]|nr:DUF2493 domain-containing protein [Clostridia bacterium]
MIKKIVVAGCRDYQDYEQAKEYIDFCISNIKKKYTLVFVSGGCAGADMLGERYARENGYEIERYPAEWEKYGRSAGPKRNEQMAKAADFVICFWDGQSRGTKTMIEFARQMGKRVKIKKIKLTFPTNNLCLKH